jgi:DNA-binding FadR family transcriptional regulator
LTSKKGYPRQFKKDQEDARALMNEHLTWVEEKWKDFGRKKK